MVEHVRLKKAEQLRSAGSHSEVVPLVNISSMARLIGVDRSHLSRVLNGKVRLGVETLFRAAKRMKWSVEKTERWFADAILGHEERMKQRVDVGRVKRMAEERRAREAKEKAAV